MTQSNSSKVLRGVSSQTVVTIVIGLVELLYFSIMSRLLGKEDFGYFAAITAVTTVFSSLAETGIGSAVVQRKVIDKKYLDNAFSLSFVIGVILTASLSILSMPISVLIIDSTLRIPLVILSCTLLLQCVSSVPRSVLHRNRMFFRIGLASSISLIVSSLTSILLAIKGFGFYAILAKLVLNSLMSYVIYLFLAKEKFNFAWNKEVLQKIFGFSGWLMASALFRNISHSIDSLIMPRLMSISLLGAYNRPQGFISQISSQLNGIFDSALFPVLSEIQDDPKALGKAYMTSTYFLNIFAMILSIGFIFNSELLIRIFFGEQWIELKGLFIVLSIALIFNIDIRLTDCYLRSLALTKSQFVFRIVGFVLKILCLVVGSHWGLMGFAVGGVVSVLATMLIKMAYISNKVHISFVDTLLCALSSWRAGLLLVPLMIACAFLIPSSLFGNIVNSLVLMVLCFVIFLFNPKIVGKKYEQNVYPKVKSIIEKKVPKIIKRWFV